VVLIAIAKKKHRLVCTIFRYKVHVTTLISTTISAIVCSSSVWECISLHWRCTCH